MAVGVAPMSDQESVRGMGDEGERRRGHSRCQGMVFDGIKPQEKCVFYIGTLSREGFVFQVKICFLWVRSKGHQFFGPTQCAALYLGF